MESLYGWWDWLMSLSIVEVFVILVAFGAIIIQIAAIIIKWLEHRKNGGNGGNGRNGNSNHR
jgi:hypothetical protein